MIRLIRQKLFADPRLALVSLLVVVVILSASAFRAAPVPLGQETPQVTPLPAVLTPDAGSPTPTPLPEEYLNNQQQTIGLTLAAAALVLVVVIGVLTTFMQNPGDA